MTDLRFVFCVQDGRHPCCHLHWRHCMDTIFNSSSLALIYLKLLSAHPSLLGCFHLPANQTPSMSDELQAKYTNFYMEFFKFNEDEALPSID